MLMTTVVSKYILLFFIAVAEFVLLYIIFQSIVVLGYSLITMRVPSDCGFDYIIVHGCGPIRGDRISKILKSRLDKAVEVFHRGGDRATLILSGGRASEDRVSEAEAMRRYLVKHDIPEDKMILEDQSRSTRQNLKYSKKIIEELPGEKRLALISSNYHIFRCMGIAGKLGLNCKGIGAPVRKKRWLRSTIEEFRTEFARKKKRLPLVRTFVLYALVPTVIAFALLFTWEYNIIIG